MKKKEEKNSDNKTITRITIFESFSRGYYFYFFDFYPNTFYGSTNNRYPLSSNRYVDSNSLCRACANIANYFHTRRRLSGSCVCANRIRNLYACIRVKNG